MSFTKGTMNIIKKIKVKPYMKKVYNQNFNSAQLSFDGVPGQKGVFNYDLSFTVPARHIDRAKRHYGKAKRYSKSVGQHVQRHPVKYGAGTSFVGSVAGYEYGRRHGWALPGGKKRRRRR